MKKILLPLIFLVLMRNVAFSQTSEHTQNPLYFSHLDSFRITSPVYAGEYIPVSVKFGISSAGGDLPPDTIQVQYNYSAPLTSLKTINIIGLDLIMTQSYYHKYLLFYIKYPQPGTYFPIFSCDWRWTTSQKLTVLPNPKPLPPVIYKIPDQTFYQGDVVSILLSKYVTDANNDLITWSATSTNKYLKISFDDQTAVLSSPNGGGESVVTFYANDGRFTTKSTIKVTVHPVKAYTVKGHIFDIFTNDTLPGAKIMVNDRGTIKRAVTDINGNFTITVHTTGIPASTNYFPVTITAKNYTPRHTWIDVTKSTQNLQFSLIPASFNWRLYDNTMRGEVGKISADTWTTIHWIVKQPEIIILDHGTEHVASVDQQVKDVVWNIKNRLVKFNPVNTNPDSIKIIKNYYDNWWRCKMSIGWAEHLPIGSYSITTYGPFLIDANAAFNPAGGYIPDKESAVYNQELGSCMGADDEPNYPGAEYQSVFAGYTRLVTYSKDDYKMGEVYTHRSLHYVKLNDNGLNSEDWEVRPDIVAKKLAEAKKWVKLYYTKSTEEKINKSTEEKITRTLHLVFKDGSSKTWQFPLNKIPQDLINTVSLEHIKGLVKYGFLPKQALIKKQSAAKE